MAITWRGPQQGKAPLMVRQKGSRQKHTPLQVRRQHLRWISRYPRTRMCEETALLSFAFWQDKPKRKARHSPLRWS